MKDVANNKHDWRRVDRTLRVIAKRRAQLDAVEARWLREAVALEIWKPLGMVSAIDYLERVLDYAPHTARERLRVAEALGELPELAKALARKDLQYSAVRELTRIAVPETQVEWIAAAKGKNQRELETLVSGRRKGSRPSDPVDPEIRMRSLLLKLAPDAYARFRQARVALAKEHGRDLDDTEVIAALANAYLDGPPGTQPTERARHQIALTVCELCRQGWQEGGGQQIAVDAATVERAECDAQHIGSIHAETPARAHQDIPPAVRRLVIARDGGCCQIPGCRSARNVDLHHLRRRVDGGGHDPSNIICACGSCHRALHEGRLIVSGTAKRLVVHRPGEPDPDAELDADGAIAAELDALAHELDDTADAPVELGAEISEGFAPSSIGRSAASQGGRDTNAIDSVEGVPDTAEPEADESHVGRAHVAIEAKPQVTYPSVVTSEAIATPDRADTATGDASHVGRGAIQGEQRFDAVSPAPAAGIVASEAFATPECAVRTPGDMSHVGRDLPAATKPHSKLDHVIVRSQARDALVGAGWKPAIARGAVDAALAADAEAPLEQVIVKALAFCLRATT